MIKYSSACFFLEKRKFTLSQRANFFARLTPLKMLARSHLNGIWVYFLLEYCSLANWCGRQLCCKQISTQDRPARSSSCKNLILNSGDTKNPPSLVCDDDRHTASINYSWNLNRLTRLQIKFHLARDTFRHKWPLSISRWWCIRASDNEELIDSVILTVGPFIYFLSFPKPERTCRQHPKRGVT
jgi:hypothetical protein